MSTRGRWRDGRTSASGGKLSRQRPHPATRIRPLFMTSRLSAAPPELAQFKAGVVDLDLSFKDEDFAVAKRRRGAHGGRVSAGGSSGSKNTKGQGSKVPKIENLDNVLETRITTLLPRLEDLRGKMTAQLTESQSLFKTAGKDHIESKAIGVSEKGFVFAATFLGCVNWCTLCFSCQHIVSSYVVNLTCKRPWSFCRMASLRRASMI